MKLQQTQPNEYVIKDGRDVVAHATRKAPGLFHMKRACETIPRVVRVREAWLEEELLEALA